MANRRNDLTIEYLRECFDPDFENGVLYWARRPEHHFKNKTACKRWNTRYSGTLAGNIYTRSKSGYQSFQVGIQNRSYLVHRILWALYTGSWSKDDISHIDGNPLNNRIENLCEETHSQNMRFARKKRSNTSGITGVAWSKKRQRWIVSVPLGDYIRPYLTQSDNLFEAVCARKNFEKINGFRLGHGTDF